MSPINISKHSAITTVRLKFVLFRRSLVRKEHGGTPPPSPDEGRLQPIAAKVLMNILYAARLCRFDLLRAVCHLRLVSPSGRPGVTASFIDLCVTSTPPSISV